MFSLNISSYSTATPSAVLLKLSGLSEQLTGRHVSTDQHPVIVLRSCVRSLSHKQRNGLEWEGMYIYAFCSLNVREVKSICY